MARDQRPKDLGLRTPLPAPLTIPELDAIRTQEGGEETYKALRSLMEAHNSLVAFNQRTSGRGAKDQSSGPLFAGGRGTACSVTLFWQTRGDGFTPTFYQIWQADAGTAASPTEPIFDDAMHTARVPAEINTPLITRSRHVWTDNDFTALDVAAGIRRTYWITAIDVQGNESLPVKIGPLTPGDCSGGGGGGGGSAEILIIADLAVSDVTVTLPDPATFTDPKTIVNVKVLHATGAHVLTILPGVAGTIDYLDGIQTLTPNQGYRFRMADTADTVLPTGTTETGWTCIETVYGGESGAVPVPPYVPGPCSMPLPTAEEGDFYDVQLFQTPGAFTWTKPSSAKPGAGNVVIDMIGGGGAGQFAEGSTCTISAGGGGGGGGGQRSGVAYDPADLPATVPVTVGAGGAPGTGGGNSGTVNPTSGTDGGDSEFGSPVDAWYLKALGGKVGTYGACETGGGGQGGGGTPADNASTGKDGGGGGSTADNFGAPKPSGGGSQCGAPGGGGGGYVLKDTAPHTAYGGAGGLPNSTVLGGGAAGGAPERIVGGTVGGPGINGTDGDVDTPGGGGGGGGATVGTDPVYVGGPGGNGGFPGGGGGGGGASGRSEGIGGDSGRGGGGVIRITTLCRGL